MASSLTKAQLFAFLALAFLFKPASAIQVKPLLIEMKSLGKGSTATVSVVNDGANQLPVEIAVERLYLDIDSNSRTEPADQDWLVFPPQALIPPGTQQNFRVQWLGEPNLAKSESYYLAVKQVPVEMPEGQSGIQLVYNIRALINVAPADAQSALKVDEATVEFDGEESAIVNLLLKNDGARHAMLSEHELSLVAKNAAGKAIWTHRVSRGEIYQTIGGGLVQPKQQRRFKLPVNFPEAIANSEINLDASVEKAEP